MKLYLNPDFGKEEDENDDGEKEERGVKKEKYKGMHFNKYTRVVVNHAT
jgi:hypothetical protein